MPRETISVLLPYRDAEGTLDEAVESILSQRGVALELIAVDDGSRDGSARVLARAARSDPRVRMLSTGGAGIAAALQLGAEQARGSLLARMDADDIALPDRLCAQEAALASAPGIAVLGTCVRVFPDPALGMQRYIAWQNSLLDTEQHRAQLFVESPLCHPSVMMRRIAFDAVGGYRAGPFPEDYDLWLRFDAAGYALAKLGEVLLAYRQHARCLTRTDPRYARERFLPLKAPYLARRVHSVARPIDVWGAGATGKRVARALEPFGIFAERFFDIDPEKIGRSARGAPVVSLEELPPPGERCIIVALGARGARDAARAQLARFGHREGLDYLCAS